MGPKVEHAQWSPVPCLSCLAPRVRIKAGRSRPGVVCCKTCWWGAGGEGSGLLEGWAGSKAKAFRNRDSNPGLSGESRLS